MSHFSVLVIGDDPKTLLAPYDENIDVAPYAVRENAETPDDVPGVPEAREYLAVWQNLHPLVGDNPTVEQWMSALIDAGLSSTLKDVARIELAAKHRAILEQPMTWAAAAALHNAWFSCGADELMFADEDGVSRWSTYNPKSKWDWYVLGGRWNGFFIRQHGEKTNQLRKHEVDWPAMRNVGNVKGHSEMDQVFRVIAGLPTPTRWATIRDSGISMGAARDLYHTQPAVEALNKAGLYQGPECLVKTYCLDSPDPRAAYVARRESSAVTPFAICTHNWWRSRGDMGLLGAVTDPADDWPERAARIIDAAPDDALFSLFDAHI